MKIAKRRRNEEMKSGTKLALTIAGSAIALGVLIEGVRIFRRKRAVVA